VHQVCGLDFGVVVIPRGGAAVRCHVGVMA
jgi:hypothetical protein